MKKILVITAAVLLAIGMTASFSFADGSANGITGSPHDFSTTSTPHDTGEVAWNMHPGEICRVCHIPHDVENPNLSLSRLGDIKTDTSSLIWNRKLSSETYDTYVLDGSPMDQPDGTSVLCLGCHDDTVALGTFDKYAGGGNPVDSSISDMDSEAVIGGNTASLARTHPISIDYPSDETDSFNDPNTAKFANGDTVADELEEIGSEHKVQCATC
ncbi:MAG: hypothetical protein GXP58_11520, partial [Deltaproteobacteria bacterium]|nr:hypothetical protein [Deltaproteobacteria bacterium]